MSTKNANWIPIPDYWSTECFLAFVAESMKPKKQRISDHDEFYKKWCSEQAALKAPPVEEQPNHV